MASLSIPKRAEVSRQDQWDLSSLCKDTADWEQGFLQMQELAKKAEIFKGTLGTNPQALKDALKFWMDVELLDEKIGYFAHLQFSEDSIDAERQGRWGRYMSLATTVRTAGSYLVPEIQAIDDEKMRTFLESPELADYRIYLSKMLRHKPHILSEAEETLIAMQSESAQTAHKAFSALSDADLEFGTIKTAEGDKPVSQSSFSEFMQNPDREIRAQAYAKFYDGFDKHKNTIAALYAGSIHQDIYLARARRFPSARAASLFSDNIPQAVYDNLVAAVRGTLPALHRYYALRKKALKLDELRHYDVYVSLLPDVKTHYTFDAAVDLVCEALSPLGDEYTQALRKGLTGGWVDKYENKGKRSGAFSAGSFAGDPYILMNYKENVMRDVFTLAHEAGHSMHSWYCSKNNPIQHYNYTIFEAETASTFNEQLLFDFLHKRNQDPKMKTYLLVKQTDDILATLFRQTMFAEYEHKVHEIAQSGGALTVDVFRSEYRELLTTYFGPQMVLEGVSDLEGLRIPHFYRAFYVYKYSTGICAAMTLAKKVLSGGTAERDNYLAFLKTGGSLYPIESLKKAGADLSRPEPIENGLKTFSDLVVQLEKAIPG